ncbi:MAG: sigma-70 family RNA polymerase sigma factor [Bacteroidetes bacterium]|nr:sigma-70 family RNA polymerase sigma factor [Bacteroidota bacterium]
MQNHGNDMGFEPSDAEKEMVDGCRKGMPKYQEMFYKKYYGKMLGVTLRYSESRDEAKDVLQEGYVKAFKHIVDFVHNGNIEAWLRRIMVNSALDNIRRKKADIMTTDLNTEFGEEKYGEENTISHLNYEELLGMMHSLPTGYKLVFNLFAIEGYTHKEIGEKFGISESTSKSQYARAKQAMQKMIEERENINLLNKISHE